MHHLARKVLFIGGGVAALWGGSKLYNRFKNGPAPSPSAPTSTSGTSTSAQDASAGTITGPNPGDTNGLVTSAGSSDISNGGFGVSDATMQADSSGGDSASVDTSSGDASSVLDSFSSDLGYATDAASILGM